MQRAGVFWLLRSREPVEVKRRVGVAETAEGAWPRCRNGVTGTCGRIGNGGPGISRLQSCQRLRQVERMRQFGLRCYGMASPLGRANTRQGQCAISAGLRAGSVEHPAADTAPGNLFPCHPGSSMPYKRGWSWGVLSVRPARRTRRRLQNCGEERFGLLTFFGLQLRCRGSSFARSSAFAPGAGRRPAAP